MPDATLKDFEELVGKVHKGEFPIMPQSTWGQDAAYLGFLIDGMQGQIRQLIKAAEVGEKVRRYEESLGVVARDGHITGCWCREEAKRALTGTNDGGLHLLNGSVGDGQSDQARTTDDETIGPDKAGTSA